MLRRLHIKYFMRRLIKIFGKRLSCGRILSILHEPKALTDQDNLSNLIKLLRYYEYQSEENGRSGSILLGT